MAFADDTAGVLLTQGDGIIPRQRSLIEGLPVSVQARVRAHGRVQACERGETIFAQGELHDGIAVIETGLIRSFYKAPAGREITLAYWMPGNFVGGPDIFGGGTHIWSAVAAKRSVVTHLPGLGLRDLARETPDLAIAIIDALAFKAQCYSSLAQMLGTRSLTQRLAQVLLHLSHTYGFKENAGADLVIAAAFTHSEIANLIGGTRQWVTISLNRLQTAGVLTHGRGLLVLKRLDVLSAAAAAEER